MTEFEIHVIEAVQEYSEIITRGIYGSIGSYMSQVERAEMELLQSMEALNNEHDGRWER